MLLILINLALGSDLRMEVRGLDASTGSVLCTLYADPEVWLADPGWVSVVSAAPSDGRATCDFGPRPPGRYAVSFIHDLDGDGDMDTNWLGLPKEPWGFSMDPKVTFGPPTFDSAAFRHPSPTPIIGHAR
jgi:uncharacterized protein (DUF2141 family)